jgi:hypothetical protein
MMKFSEFIVNQPAANVAGSNVSAIISQLDPAKKAQWDKLIADLPKLYSFLTDIYKTSKGSWEIQPAQLTALLNKHILTSAGSLGSTQSAPFAPK